MGLHCPHPRAEALRAVCRPIVVDRVAVREAFANRLRRQFAGRVLHDATGGTNDC
jgi:hypothetical protein